MNEHNDDNGQRHFDEDAWTMLHHAAVKSGWNVILLEDEKGTSFIAQRDTNALGDPDVQDQLVIKVHQSVEAEKFRAYRVINSVASDATNSAGTVLDWLINTAIADAELRGSEGMFEYVK